MALSMRQLSKRHVRESFLSTARQFKGNTCIRLCATYSNYPQRKPNLWEEYAKAKQKIREREMPPNLNPWTIFPNNELDLEEIQVYGFDYDFTLAEYRQKLDYLIYDLAKNEMVSKLKYPQALIKELEYIPYFAVRGLHCDIRKGLLLKIDAFHNIQLGTVYRGMRALSDEEVRRVYQGLHVSLDNMSGYYGQGDTMVQFIDMFARPEITLFCQIIEYFETENILYDPEYVFHDVQSAVRRLHLSGLVHSDINKDLSYFILRNSRINSLVRRLVNAGKQLFIVTNSSYEFVNQGMNHIVGTDWRSLFDVIVCNARKPNFFRETQRPFRRYDPSVGVRTYDKITQLQKGEVYEEGNLYQLHESTGWYGPSVLYFGDHIYNDLTDANLKHGWRTAAIIPELKYEIQIQNSDKFKTTVRWLVALQGLIERMQVYRDAESQTAINEWQKERDQLRATSKTIFNTHFGSVFRTYHNPTYFTRRLSRFADCYMASVGCLQDYSLHHCFYPRRYALPHESSSFRARGVW